MRHQLTAAVAASLLATCISAQAPAGRPSRTADGKPNLNGVWQALNTANWDLQTHGPSAGPPALGAIGATPPGLGVVEGGEIPYLPQVTLVEFGPLTGS